MMAEKDKISDQRWRLQAKIEAFQQNAAVLLNGQEVALKDGGHCVTNEENSSILSGEESETNGEDGDSGDVEPILAENAYISMPSALGKEECARVGWNIKAGQEVELRKAQANEYLEKIRMALGHKALLFRTSVRKVKGQKGKTRTWDAVHRADKNLQDNVRGYERARKALVSLGADMQTLDQYKEIKKSDLRLSGDVVEENRFGQKSDALPWFWKLGGNDKDQDDDWMNECEWQYVKDECVY